MSINRRQFTLAGVAAATLSLHGASVASSEPIATSPVPSSAEHDMTEMPAHWVKPDQIAVLIYPGMTALDMVAPHYAFASLMGATVHIVAARSEPVVSDNGLTITPTTTFADCPFDLDVLCIPGGSAGTLNAMRDDATLDFIQSRGEKARFVTSVCTGSLLLGAAGLLDGYRATSHWGALPILGEFGAIAVKDRVVRDRNRLTGGGVTAGMDLGLTIVAFMRDEFYAKGVQLMAQYAPEPPFDSGTPERASPELVKLMDSMFVSFRTDAKALARQIVAQRHR